MSTPKIDLRNRGPVEHPPEIALLIEKYNGIVGNAERAAGISLGMFSKITRKSEKYTDNIKSRVRTALANEVVLVPKKGENPMGNSKLIIPDSAPPLLAELVRFTGSKARATKALGTSDGSFYAVLSGRREMPPEWIIKAKVAMGQSLIAETVREPSQGVSTAQMPEFVPWDGKSKGTVKTRAHGKAKPRVIKNVPQPLVDLFNKHEGNVSGAARAIGMTGGALFLWMDGTRPFKEENQRKVHAAMHGMPASNDISLGEQFDKYTLGLAIILLKGANFDRIADIADILNGRMVFRKNTTTGWILIYKMATEDLPKFKKLALRDASEIVCP